MSDFSSGTTLLEESSWPGHQTFVTAWHFWSDEYQRLSSEKEGSRKENVVDSNQEGATTSESDTKETTMSPSRPFKISIRHSIASNAYILIVNGEIIKRGSETMYVRTFSIPFTLPNESTDNSSKDAWHEREGEVQCMIHVNVSSAPTLEVNNCKIADIKAKMAMHASMYDASRSEGMSVLPSPLPSKERGKADLRLGVNSIPFGVGITDYRQFLGANDETTITVYQIYVELPLLTGQVMSANQSLSIMRAMRRGSLLIVERRYSEFERLDKILKCLAMDSHTLASMPSLPGKALITNNSPEFLKNRQNALNEWLQRVLEMIGSFAYPTEFFTFCGCDPLSGSRNAKYHGSITDGGRTESEESVMSDRSSILSFHSIIDPEELRADK